MLSEMKAPSIHPAVQHQAPVKSLNSAPCVGDFFNSSTNASNLGDMPGVLILLRAATARSALLCSSAARSRSCFTVSFVTVAPFMVFSNCGVASSKRKDTAAGATWERRNNIMWQITLISSESSDRPGRTRPRKAGKSIFVRQVSSCRVCD
jgi:hypothetical protein